MLLDSSAVFGHLLTNGPELLKNAHFFGVDVNRLTRDVSLNLIPAVLVLANINFEYASLCEVNRQRLDLKGSMVRSRRIMFGSFDQFEPDVIPPPTKESSRYLESAALLQTAHQKRRGRAP
jgi:hypothetical protein